MDVHHREETMGTAETIAVENAHMPPCFALTITGAELDEGLSALEDSIVAVTAG
jgi:hypothetical protein